MSLSSLPMTTLCGPGDESVGFSAVTLLRQLSYEKKKRVRWKKTGAAKLTESNRSSMPP